MTVFLAEGAAWLSDGPISEWSGVATDDNGGVTGLDLGFGFVLRDNIPSELGNPTRLEVLTLGGLTRVGI